MLVITRKIGETVNIGYDVKVTVLGIRGNQIRIGIEAPQEVHILRAELVERDRKESEKGR